jgi:PAS domain S-box-containing protein
MPDREAFDDDGLLRAIMDGTARETGAGFFRALVKNLSRALGTHGAWVTEYRPREGRLQALAFWLGDGYVEDYVYDIAGTPCAATIRNKTHLHIPERVIQLFPGDPDLPRLGAVSYMGFPLLDPENRVLGNLAVLDTRPMPESLRNLTLFRIFAARATAEVLRLRAEAETRLREAKLSSLFAGALDAIVEVDAELRVQMLNPSAEEVLGLRGAEAAGTSFDPFLDPQDRQRLAHVIRQLNARPPGKRRAWIPDGLTLVAAQGRRIAAEATCSRIDAGGSPHYVLILRDVNARLEAERTIATLRDEARSLRDEIRSITHQGELLGASPAFRRTLQLAAEVAPTDATVLIHGETGTGKERIAQAIHAVSRRQARPLVTVNCAAIPQGLMESEFFGHAQGAFTGATQRREGRFALADGGTIFLDEVAELNLEMQAKLLRVLQEGEFSPVGSSQTRRVDVRVIAATNRDLSREAVIPFDARDLARLEAYPWPGNVRELQNVIERAVITAGGGRPNLAHALPETPGAPVIPPADSAAVPGTLRTAAEMQALERDNLRLALETAGWRVAGANGAANLLGIPPSTLQSRMKALGIRRPR